MRFIKLIKRPLFFVPLFIILAAVFAVYFYFFRKTAPVRDFALVKRGDIVQEVSVTGKIKPVEEVELAFEKSGKVLQVYMKVGDSVHAGQHLASLNSADLYADLAQAQASLASQRAELAELLRGTRPEQLQITESKVQSAEVALAEARKNLLDKLHDAYTKSDDAVRNHVDQFFSNPRGASPSVNFAIGDSQLRVGIENGRSVAENILVDWQSALQNLTVAGDLNSYSVSADNNLDIIKSFLDKVSLAVNSFTIDAWKLDVSTARTNMNTGVTNLSTAVEKFRSAQTALTIAENQLILEKAGSAIEQVAAQEALVKQAEAKVQSVETQIAKNTIVSPINGIVTRQDAKVGEILSANSIVISIISVADFQVEANIPEVDIAKVHVGEPADITLDAYGENVIFKSRVIKIDPAEIVIESVSTYKATFQFEKKDERIKSGMTANITIFSDRRGGVLYIPQRAVTAKNGDKFVQVFALNGTEERKVVTGLKDANGNIEIISGLNEGEKVINSVKN